MISGLISVVKGTIQLGETFFLMLLHRRFKVQASYPSTQSLNSVIDKNFLYYNNIYRQQSILTQI